MTVTRRSLLSTLAACAALAAPLQAAAADPRTGRLLAAQCAQCHGTNGHAVSGAESLAGESAPKLQRELMEMKYRSGGDSIMDKQARGYTDEQLRLIADYFAAQPSTPPAASRERPALDPS